MEIDELSQKYAFRGRTQMSIPKALEIKEELETIDRLLKQLEEAARRTGLSVAELQRRYAAAQREGLQPPLPPASRRPSAPRSTSSWNERATVGPRSWHC